MSGAASIPSAAQPDAHTSRNGTGADAWQHVDWRAHQRWVPIEGGRPVNVLDLGSGAPVVFVHGLGGSWPNWLHQLPAIATGWRTIALDLPGFGHSPMPAGPISIAGYARTVVAVMDALGISEAAIVGNSMGGEISAELAISHPDRAQRIVLVSPAGISTASLTARMALIRRAHPAVHSLNRWIAHNADTFARRPRLRNAALAAVAAERGHLDAAFAAEQIRGMGKPGFLDALEAITTHSQDLAERLPAISCPTLIVWGDKDPLIPVRDADVFGSRIPGSHKVIWENTGHVAMFERPNEFNALLEGFLSG